LGLDVKHCLKLHSLHAFTWTLLIPVHCCRYVIGRFWRACSITLRTILATQPFQQQQPEAQALLQVLMKLIVKNADSMSKMSCWGC
jgi:hypothetical protein